MSVGDLSFVLTLQFTLPHFAQKCQTATNSYATTLPFSENNKTGALHCDHKPHLKDIL
jgi:hypothetical protein